MKVMIPRHETANGVFATPELKSSARLRRAGPCKAAIFWPNGPASDAGIGRLHEPTGRPVLSAAAESQESWEFGDLGHGLFTAAVIEALRHGDKNGDGYVSVTELASYVQDLVPKLIKDPKARKALTGRGLAGGQQSVQFGATGSDFALVKQFR